MKIEIATNLKDLRKEKGWTQKEAANRIYLSRESYASYETGRLYPQLITVVRMADVFNVTLNRLIFKYEEYECYKCGETSDPEEMQSFCPHCLTAK